MNPQLRYHHAHRPTRSQPAAICRWFAATALAALTVGCSPTRVDPKVVADLPGYSEGIVFDAKGAAFASTLHREAVYVIEGSAAPSIWYRTTEPNGHRVLPDGTHLLAARGGIHHVSADGTLIEILAKELATPNDLALDGDGGAYISVPADSSQDRDALRSGVYYLDSKRLVLKVAGDFCYPNGVVVRPDGKTLLVNDSCNRQIHEFQITSPGVIAGRRLFAELPDPKSVPDGMTIDQAGRLYVADYGTGNVVVFDQAGQLLHRYPTGLEHPSNVAFGGPTLTDLYVTGSQGNQDGPGQLVVLPLRTVGRSGLTPPTPSRPR